MMYHVVRRVRGGHRPWKEGEKPARVGTCDRPEVINGCVNCKRPDCPGECEDVRRRIREKGKNGAKDEKKGALTW